MGFKHFLNDVMSGRRKVKDLPNFFEEYFKFKSIQKLSEPVIETKYGTKMFINKNDEVISKSLVLNKVWEYSESEFFKKLITKGMNIIDIGANIGYFSILFSKLTGDSGKVFSFEPEPNNFQFLLKNIQANNSSNIIPFNKAVSNYDGKINLFLSRSNIGDHRMINFNSDREVRNRIEIESVKLDTAIPKDQKIDLIKMDIQGSEMKAIDGMKRILGENNKMVLVTEFWPYAIKQSGYEPEDFFNVLNTYGFKIYTLEGSSKIPVAKDFKMIHKYSSLDYTNLICEKS